MPFIRFFVFSVFRHPGTEFLSSVLIFFTRLIFSYYYIEYYEKNNGQSLAKRGIFMISEEIMEILGIESEEDFMYFDPFAALMETEEKIDYDTFAEILLSAGQEALQEVLPSFFEDVIRGIPDDNTDLYAAVQSEKDVLLTLAGFEKNRGFGFLADELFRFREWYLSADTVICTPESGGTAKSLSPCEAFMLFREEKLSGEKYLYDFSAAEPPVPDDYLLDRIAEISEELPQEEREEDSLPDEYDPDAYGTDLTSDERPIDPYTEGFVDRDHPVIEGSGIDPYREEE